MKKILRRLGVLAVSLGAGLSVALAQQPARPAPTAAELKAGFDRITAGTEGEDQGVDSLFDVLPRRLVIYLKTHEGSTEDLGVDLYDTTKDAARLRLFGYSISSGGTRGTVHRSVLQWRNAAGQRFAYALQEECEFANIYKLASPGRSLYLLLGQETANSYTDVSEAYVVELKGNYLLLNNAIFGKSPLLSLGNVEMTFDKSKQQLYLKAVPSERPPIPREIYVANPTPLARWKRQGQRAPNAVTLKFNGTCFVQSQ